MANKTITFKMLAYSDAAGKYDPQAPLNGNEDNFYVDDDLSDEMTGRCQMDKVVTLSDCGCLMVVADGMGGMNAGEVASEIAINTVKDFFAPGKIDRAMAESASQRKKLLEQVIKEADKRVKEDAKTNVEHEGMGSTIILAWIVGDKLTLSWCGDSRAYRFNPRTGIEPLSRDHSYVQELVNQGKLTYEDTFEHPQGNIVTRSLGDPSCTAQPETREFDLYNEDIILLCSDGLSGVLRDKKVKDHYGNYYPGETIEDIIAQHTQSVIECRTALMQAAENADWYDNVTVLLFQITGGTSAMPVKKEEVKEEEKVNTPVKKPKALPKWTTIGLAGILCIGCFLLGRYYRPFNQSTKNDEEKVDSTALIPVQVVHPVDTPRLAPPAQEAEQVQSTDSLKNQAEWNQWKTDLKNQLSPFAEFKNEDMYKKIIELIQNTNYNKESERKLCESVVKELKVRCEYLSKLLDIQNKIQENDKQNYNKWVEKLKQSILNSKNKIVVMSNDDLKEIEKLISNYKNELTLAPR